MIVTLVPIYVAEVAPPATRGLLVGQHGMFTNKLSFGLHVTNNLRWLLPFRIHHRSLGWCRSLLF